MKKLIILFISLSLVSCEKYITEIPTLTLSGKYVVSKLDITNVDQPESRDSLYTLGQKYVNHLLPTPFDSIVINRFYIHFDYSAVKINWTGINDRGDIWQYPLPNQPNGFIYYYTLSNNAYNSGYVQFTYFTGKSNQTMTFLIEDDGFETLQLKSSGAWFKGKYGEKQVMTLLLTRVGP